MRDKRFEICGKNGQNGIFIVFEKHGLEILKNYKKFPNG